MSDCEEWLKLILTGPIEQFEDPEFVARILPDDAANPANRGTFKLFELRQMINQARLAEAAKESAIAAKEAARSARVATVVAFGAFTVAALTLWLSMTLGG